MQADAPQAKVLVLPLLEYFPQIRETQEEEIWGKEIKPE